MSTRIIAIFLSLALLVTLTTSVDGRSRRKKPQRIPWKSRIFLDNTAFQQDFGSITDLKAYMTKHDRKVLGPAKGGKYTIHFMAFFKKLSSDHIYILIWDASKSERESIQRYDFRGISNAIDRLASAFKISTSLVTAGKRYQFELKAKSGKGAVLLAKTEFQVK